MHLFSFENEEDKESCLNKCMYIFFIFFILLVDSLFCPMNRLTTVSYAEKWKSIPKTSEHKLVMVFTLFDLGKIIHK